MTPSFAVRDASHEALPVAEQNRKRQLLERLAATGLPTRKQEAWHYLDLRELHDKSFSIAKPGSLTPETLAEIRSQQLPGFDLVVIWNGQLQGQLSDCADFEFLGDLNPILQTSFDQCKTAVSDTERRAAVQTEFFEGYIEALQNHSNYLRLPSETRAQRPLQILIGQDSGSGKTDLRLTAHELWIDLGQRSSSNLIVSFVGRPPTDGNAVFSRIKIRAQAQCASEILVTQALPKEDFFLSRLSLIAEKESQIRLHVFQKGARLSRHQVDVLLTGGGTTVDVNGAYELTANQVVDHHTDIQHLDGNCGSSQLYKGTIDGHARAVFDGRVVIHAGAQKARSTQLNKNLLLSETAEADAKPQLEILADDVTATHGATVGQIDEGEVFYLLSRGIKELEARAMLAEAFLQDMTQQIAEPRLRSVAEGFIREHT